MEIAHLRASLQSHRCLALDTSIFIYQWEGNARYSPLTDYIFSSLDRAHFVGVTSTITMTELLVYPYRSGDLVRANDLFALLSTYPNLQWIAPIMEIATRAAHIRARWGLRTPDALQAATALEANASVLVTNDPIFKRVSGLATLLLDEYL